MKQTWVRSSRGGIFPNVNFGGKKKWRLRFAYGKLWPSLLTLLIAFCWFAVLRTWLKRMLLRLNFFFTLPSFDIPGPGCLHSGQACSTVGKTADLKTWLNICLQPITVAGDCTERECSLLFFSPHLEDCPPLPTVWSLILLPLEF